MKIPTATDSLKEVVVKAPTRRVEQCIYSEVVDIHTLDIEKAITKNGT